MTNRICSFLLLSALFLPLMAVAHNKDQNTTAKPLNFIANNGQVTDQHGKTRKDIDAKLDCGGGLTIFAGDGQLHYQWMKPSSKQKVESRKLLTGADRQQPAEYTYCRMDVELVGANKQAAAVLEDAQPYHESYYLPHCPNGAVAHSYGRLVYKNVYPGIDWVLYTRDGALKHEFVVRPGGDPGKIKLRYAGATLQLGEDGVLTATTAYGSITEAAPYSYDAATRKTIASRYRLQGNVLGYATEATDDGATLVIDPVLKWATYYGGSNGDEILDMAADTAGNVYIGGQTRSTNNIATTGALQGSLVGNQNIMIAKFDLGGIRQWGSYYGAGSTTYMGGLSADAAGNVYVCGTAGGGGLGTTGTHQPNHAGLGDALLLKLNTLGGREWCSYLGTAGYNEQAADVSVNYAGDVIYLGVDINSSSAGMGLATTGAYQSSSASALAKFTNAGQRVWCTYTNMTIATLTEDAGNVYTGGISSNATGIGTAGTHQPALIGSENMALMKFNGTGGLLWGTYYSNQRDALNSICADAAGNVYIAGMAANNAFPILAKPGAHQTAMGGYMDGFLAKFNGSTGTRIWGTYFGGAFPDGIHGINIDHGGRILVCGNSMSSNAITTPNGHLPSFQGVQDAFLAIFNSNGAQLYGTYYGGTDAEGIGSICYEKGRITIGGETWSTSGIATAAAHQTTYGGGIAGDGDGMLVQFAADTTVYITNLQQLAQLCVSEAVQLRYDVSQPFQPGNSFTLQLSNASGSFAAPTTLGTVTNQTGGTFNFNVPGLPAGSGYRMRILATAPGIPRTI
jgi:hypothetical protein